MYIISIPHFLRHIFFDEKSAHIPPKVPIRPLIFQPMSLISTDFKTVNFNVEVHQLQLAIRSESSDLSKSDYEIRNTPYFSKFAEEIFRLAASANFPTVVKSIAELIGELIYCNYPEFLKEILYQIY